MQASEGDRPDLSWLAYFGQELQVARNEMGLSVRELAASTTYSYQQISNVEAGRRTPSEEFAAEVDAALQTNGRFARILARVLAEPVPTWFQGARREEQRATKMRIYQPQVVPGLMQEKGYARALMQAARPWLSADRLDAEVELRSSRQEILRKSDPPMVWVILDESALQRPIGGQAVFRAQLERLLKEAASPSVVLQVVPLKTPNHPALDGSFTIWSYPDRPDVMYSEGMLSGTIIERREDVEAAVLAYDLLQAVALPPGEASLQSIRSALKDYGAV